VRRLSSVRALANGAQLLQLPQAVAAQDAELLAAALRTDPAVEYANRTGMCIRRSRHRAVPSRTIHSMVPERRTGRYLSARCVGCRRGHGHDARVIVAVIDSGYRPHVEFAARILPGYDFISDPFTATTVAAATPTLPIPATG